MCLHSAIETKTTSDYIFFARLIAFLTMLSFGRLNSSDTNNIYLLVHTIISKIMSYYWFNVFYIEIKALIKELGNIRVISKHQNVPPHFKQQKIFYFFIDMRVMMESKSLAPAKNQILLISCIQFLKKQQQVDQLAIEIMVAVHCFK